MSVDHSPGKYTSETASFYFSCDDGKSVLVGVKSSDHSTCPVLGIRRFDYGDSDEDTDRLISLERASEVLYGYADGPKILKVLTKAWKDFSGEDLATGEWGAGTENEIKHVVVVLSEVTALRLHVSFE